MLVLIHKNQIWVAADSLMVTENYQPNGQPTPYQQVCKIRDVGTFYWAAATPLYDNTRTGFSVEKLVDSVKSTKGSLMDVVQDFRAKAVPAIRAQLLWEKKIHPDRFARHTIDPDNVLFKFLFVRFEEGHPAAFVVLVTTGIVGGEVVVDAKDPLRPLDGFLARTDFQNL